MRELNLAIFAAGKPYTTSSCITPPGPEGSKGTVVERCDVSSLPFFVGARLTIIRTLET
jgi:hypothetical protein